ncbi:MAG: methyltransferase domain-containing protein [Spirosomataceae bacterium]
MTWEETIIQLQSDPSFSSLVRDTYLLPNLPANVERFRTSAEWAETLSLLRRYAPASTTLLDLGAGNGVASLSLALAGYQVTAAEPDPSHIVGTGAIKQLVAHYQLPQLTITEASGEKLPLPMGVFDIVYVRQALHHAADLGMFVKEASRVLKKGGILLTVRDHVVHNDRDKARFLVRHPLHRYYGGENAFSLPTYQAAFEIAGLEMLEILRPSDSVLNYDPWSKEVLKQRLAAVFGRWIVFIPGIVGVGWRLSLFRKEYIPGRLFSFVLQKR